MKLIGGPFDGCDRMPNGSRRLMLPVFEKKPVFRLESPDPSEKYEVAEYHLEQMVVFGRVLEFWRYVDLSPFEAYEQLFEGYTANIRCPRCRFDFHRGDT